MADAKQGIVSMLMLALFVAGCGSAPEQARVDTPVAARRALADAVENTIAAGPFRFEGSKIFEYEDEAEPQVAMRSEGLAALAERRAAYRIYPDEEDAGGGSSDDEAAPVDVVLDGSFAYYSSPRIIRGYPEGTEWVSFDSTEVPTDDAVWAMRVFEMPPLMIFMAAGAIDPEELDPTDRGDLAGYRFELDPRPAADAAPPEFRHWFAPLVTLAVNNEGRIQIEAEAWTDEDGLLRRLDVLLPHRDKAGGVLHHQRVRVDITTFGVDDSVEVPIERIAEWDKDLYVREMPSRLVQDVLEEARESCRSALDFPHEGDLESLADEWDVEDPASDDKELREQLAKRYVDVFYATSSTEPVDAPHLREVTKQGCLEGLESPRPN